MAWQEAMAFWNRYEIESHQAEISFSTSPSFTGCAVTVSETVLTAVEGKSHRRCHTTDNSSTTRVFPRTSKDKAFLTIQ